jgi:hypothetical protein
MGLNTEKCVKTELADSFYWEPPKLRENEYQFMVSSILGFIIRQYGGKNGNTRQLLVEVSNHKCKQNMYNGVRNTQKSPLKTSCEPVFITTKYACHTEINENVQNVSHDSQKKSIYGLTHTSLYCGYIYIYIYIYI